MRRGADHEWALGAGAAMWILARRSGWGWGSCRFQVAVTTSCCCFAVCVACCLACSREFDFTSWMLAFPVRTVMMTPKTFPFLMRKRRQLTDRKNPKSGMKTSYRSCIKCLEPVRRFWAEWVWRAGEYCVLLVHSSV